MTAASQTATLESTEKRAPVVPANAVIESIGVYLPPEQVDTSDIMAACRNKFLYPLERLTGIKSRRMAGKTEFAIDLAVNAIQICLDKSKYTAKDVDLLVCCNISRYDAPNFHFSFEPSTSAKLRHHFGMDNAISFDISNACAGMFTGVNVADAFIKAGLGERVMVVSGEYITHLTKTAQKEIQATTDNRVACLTLGDSGAAMILERSDDLSVGFHEVDMFTLGKYSDLCIARPTYDEHGGAIMFTESMRLHAVAISRSVAHVADMVRRTNWLSRMQHFIMHQTARTAIAETGQKINQFLKEEILDRSSMINNLAERGNTSTTTHFVAVWDNILNNRLQDSDDVVFAIQASGITIGTAPYTFDDLPARLREMNETGKTPAKITVQRPTPKSSARGPRVRIRHVATLPLKQDTGKRDAIALATKAGERCIAESNCNRTEIGLLIHTGVHRNEFICEPALAAIIAGNLKLNEDAESAEEHKTFAFDVLNGAVGYLDGLRTAIAMLKSGKVDLAMVCTSEIENNADYFPEQRVGIQETGSAATLVRSEDGDNSGFGAIRVDHYPQFIDDFTSWIGQDRGRSFLSFIRDPDYRSHILSCIPATVDRILEDEGLNLDDVDVVVPPLVSADFAARLARRLNLPPKKVVMPPTTCADLYTSSIPFGLAECQRIGKDKPGTIALVLTAGSGIQIGAAIYHF